MNPNGKQLVMIVPTCPVCGNRNGVVGETFIAPHPALLVSPFFLNAAQAWFCYPNLIDDAGVEGTEIRIS